MTPKGTVEVFRLTEKNNLKYYTVDEFAEYTRHCFTTRKGGVSEGGFSELNLRLNSDDKRENVIKNYNIICDELGIDAGRLVLSKQVHEDNVIKITEEHCGNGIWYENRFTSADALITNIPGIPLVTFYADCIPVMLLDPVKKAIGLVHSGWRGTVKRISAKAVSEMNREYGSEPSDIIAAIAPGIGVCCYEVGEEVYNQFRAEFGERVLENADNRLYLDLKKAVKIALSESGVENIIDSGICTACCNDLLYSHRRQGWDRGNLAAIMELK